MSTLHTPFEQKPFSLKIDDVIRKIKDVTRNEISFSDSQKSYCVGVVDIVNSTNITANLEHHKMCEYYRIFLNSMSEITKGFGAVTVKNIGDSLLYYFPDTCDAEYKSSLESVLECSLAMIESRQDINKLMMEYKLPPVNYRVSCDYGKLTIAKSLISRHDDIFGPTVNVCSKINNIAMANGIVVGGDLHQITRSFDGYGFHQLKGFSVGMRLDYPVYSLYRITK